MPRKRGLCLRLKGSGIRRKPYCTSWANGLSVVAHQAVAWSVIDDESLMTAAIL